MELFGTDGVRGVVNEFLTPQLAFKLGNAVGRVYEEEAVLVAKDTRKTGDMLESALAAGLASAGKDVKLCGVLPTPALALLSNRMKTLGIVISASHNPPEFNGIKVIMNGYKLSDELERKIEGLFEKEELVSYKNVGRVQRFDKAFDIYTGEILSMFSDLDLKGFKVDVDVANGAAYRTTPYVLEKLGADLEVHFNEPDGININHECGSTNIDVLSSRKREGVIGIAHDGDADRCLFVDEDGNEVNGDKVIGIMALSMLEEARLRKKTVVGTILTNLGLEQFLKKHGIELLRAKVGDKYVLEKMKSSGSVLGGERSGHIIFLDRSTTGDGLITALELLRAVRRAKKTLKELHTPIADYPQVMINVKVSDKSVTESSKVKKVIENLDLENYRVVVRPSGTEPVIRVMVEGEDMNQAYKIAEDIAEVVKEIDTERNPKLL
ncbi:MAG: phosphoglucosamine mutase [Thermotogaceae bacterium]|nr:phosphoglucosamine mutase [Thermotogaceae bacterium]